MDREEGISGADRKVEIKVRKNGRKDEVIVEKSVAQGLPQGWIKKLILTNRKGRKTRRDPFFIDPKSEYIFQSFKDARRYVETGDIGNYTRKLKESDIQDDDDAILPMESRKNTWADDENDKIRVSSYVRNSKEGNLNNRGEQHSIAKRVTRSQAKANKNEQDKEDMVKPILRNASTQDTTDKKFVIKHDCSTEKRITRRTKALGTKNEPSDNSLTRRASKRLAGIELEPTPELKTRTKIQRVRPDDEKSKQPTGGKELGSRGCGSDKTCATNHEKTATEKTLGSSSEVSKASVVRGGGGEAACSEQVSSYSCSAFESTLADICKDPCIAFAIKTLTGGEESQPVCCDDTNKQKEISFETPPQPLAIWRRDPCIDFAIKTLTGAIPVGSDEPKTGNN